MPTIEKIYTRDVIALDDSATCIDAAHLMAKRRIGSVGIRRGGKLVGIVTERDLLYGVLAQGESGVKSLAQVVRDDVPTVTPHATDRDCAHHMRAHFTRHLLVQEGDEVKGVVSLMDVVNLMLDDNRFLIEQLHTFIRGGRGG